MNDTYSTSELESILGISDRAIRKRLAEEGCEAMPQANPRGGEINYYDFSGFPDDYKVKILDHFTLQEQPAESLHIDEEGALLWSKLPEKDKQLALARNDILVAANAYKRHTSLKRTLRLTEFYDLLVPAIRDRDMEILFKLGFSFEKTVRILDNVKKASFQSHYRWENDFAESEKSLGLGLLGLTRVKRESEGLGSKTISKEMIAWAKALIKKGKVKIFPIERQENGRVIDCNKRLLHRRLENQFGKENLPHYAHFTKWANNWLKETQYDLTAIALPAFHRAAFGIDGGCSTTDVRFAGERWETDGTRADVMLADGRYELLAVIDAFSRDVVIEVQKTASSITVAKIFHKAMLRWGVPKQIVMDNGSIFVSQHIMAACDLLDVDPVLCKKYSPDDKPLIERFNHTLTKMLFEGMVWFIGHDPKERKRIDEYQKFDQVFYHRLGAKISCDATADELRETIEHWLEKVYRAEEHRFADVKLGRSRFILDRLANSPARAAAIKNSKALEDILSPPFDRVFNASHVTWMDMDYRPVTQEDYGRALKFGKQKVIFRPNLSDISQGTLWQAIPDGDDQWVSGDFICRVTTNVTEQSIQEFQAARRGEAKRHRDRKKAIEKVFVPDYESELARMPLPKVACGNFGAVEFDGDAYTQLTEYKSEPMPGSKPGSISDLDRERIRKELAEKDSIMAAIAPAPKPNGNGNGHFSKANGINGNANAVSVDWAAIRELPQVEQYERLMELEVNGAAIPKDLLAAMKYFEASAIYARLEGDFEMKKARLAAARYRNI